MEIDQTFWEDIEIGDELPPVVKLPTVKGAVLWGSASGDFNPLHYDLEFAKGRGLKTMIVPGAYKHASFGQLLYEWVRYKGYIKKFNVTYRGMDPPGNKITFAARVTAKGEQEGEHFVELEMWSETEPDGAKRTYGTATVVLPRGEGGRPESISGAIREEGV